MCMLIYQRVVGVPTYQKSGNLSKISRDYKWVIIDIATYPAAETLRAFGIIVLRIGTEYRVKV